MDRNYKLAKRRHVIGGVVLTVVVLFIIRLFALQILNDDYRKNADSNAFLKKIQYPSRGVIYDRTGKLLVYNQPAYDITVVMKEITSLDTADLCSTLRITPEFVRRKFRDMKNRRLNPGYSPYTNQVFLTQLRPKTAVFFKRNCLSFLVFIFSVVLSVSIITMRERIFWEILPRFPRRKWKMMIIICRVILSAN